MDTYLIPESIVAQLKICEMDKWGDEAVFANLLLFDEENHAKIFGAGHKDKEVVAGGDASKDSELPEINFDPVFGQRVDREKVLSVVIDHHGKVCGYVVREEFQSRTNAGRRVQFKQNTFHSCLRRAIEHYDSRGCPSLFPLRELIIQTMTGRG